MNRDVIEGNWKQFKALVKEKGASSPTTISRSSPAGASSVRDGSSKPAAITKDQAEVQVKAFKELHRDYQSHERA